MTDVMNQCSLKSITSSETVWINQRIQEIKEHAAWHEFVADVKGSEILLQNEAPFTYLLRSGQDKYHYVLSYVDADQSVEHKPVIIELSTQGWLYRNGASTIRPTLEELIPVAMYCKPEQCKPLVSAMQNVKNG